MDSRWLNGFRAASSGGGGGISGVPDIRQIIAGTGLTGGGALNSDVTLALADDEAASLTATGADQAGAAAIPDDTMFIRLTAGAAGTGVRLPAATVGKWMIISEEFLNASGEGGLVFHSVYPASGEAIRNKAVDLPVSIYRWTALLMYCVVDGTWDVACLPRFDGTYYYHNGNVATGQIFYALSGINAYGAIQTFSGHILFDAATGNNKCTFPDNLAEALWFGQGTTRYLNFRSSDGTERVEVKKNLLVDAAQSFQTTPATLTTSGTAITVDWNNGNIQIVDLQDATGTVVLTLSNPPAAVASYVIKVVQGSVARNITWPATVKWPGGAAPTISVADNAIDVIHLVWDGTNYLATFQQAFA